MKYAHASDESKVIGPAERMGEHRVVFYQLSRKFVDDAKSIPDDAKDVLYYTLAVGHNTGIIDCFDEVLSCSYQMYSQIVDMLPQGDARYKLAGILRSGEIQVDKTHISTLDPAMHDLLDELNASQDPALGPERDWVASFVDKIDVIKRDPAVYLLGRERD